MGHRAPEGGRLFLRRAGDNDRVCARSLDDEFTAGASSDAHVPQRAALRGILGRADVARQRVATADAFGATHLALLRRYVRTSGVDVHIAGRLSGDDRQGRPRFVGRALRLDASAFGRGEEGVGHDRSARFRLEAPRDGDAGGGSPQLCYRRRGLLEEALLWRGLCLEQQALHHLGRHPSLLLGRSLLFEEACLVGRDRQALRLPGLDGQSGIEGHQRPCAKSRLRS